MRLVLENCVLELSLKFFHLRFHLVNQKAPVQEIRDSQFFTGSQFDEMRTL